MTENNSYDILETGDLFLSKKKPLILGISPGNSYYYKNENLIKLLNFASENSEQVKLFIPDVIVTHNYRAVGAEKPERLAHVKGTRLRNRMKTILKDPNIDSHKFSFVDWCGVVEASNSYQKNFDKVMELFNGNKGFNNDICETTQLALKSFMAGRNQNGSVEEVDLQEGSLYLLKEFAFLRSLPLLWSGFQESSLVYHTEWPIMQNYFEGKYDNTAKKYLGFIIHR